MCCEYEDWVSRGAGHRAWLSGSRSSRCKKAATCSVKVRVSGSGRTVPLAGRRSMLMVWPIKWHGMTTASQNCTWAHKKPGLLLEGGGLRLKQAGLCADFGVAV